ncbi:MAG: hypothetical protein NT166_27910 [Candidatus Aminicenantes bacterium]|nr:hypothetical protein [Candidatus Aminicenantes bacterium]
MTTKKKRNMPIEVFSSLEEENLAEYRRRAQMTPMERMKEFAILQERFWGAKWTKEPMVKVIRYEKISWKSIK